MYWTYNKNIPLITFVYFLKFFIKVGNTYNFIKVLK